MMGFDLSEGYCCNQTCLSVHTPALVVVVKHSRKYRKGVDVGAPKIADFNVSTQTTGSDHQRDLLL